MTRIVTGQDLIHETELTYTPDRIWWSERSILADPTDIEIWASQVVPDGTVIHEVQIQALTLADEFALALRVNLSIVSSEFPLLAEVAEGERLIDWRWAKTGKSWYSVCNPTNERWPMRRTIHGSNMRFGVSFETQNALGCDVKVSVCYSPG